MQSSQRGAWRCEVLPLANAILYADKAPSLGMASAELIAAAARRRPFIRCGRTATARRSSASGGTEDVAGARSARIADVATPHALANTSARVGYRTSRHEWRGRTSSFASACWRPRSPCAERPWRSWCSVALGVARARRAGGAPRSAAACGRRRAGAVDGRAAYHARWRSRAVVAGCGCGAWPTTGSGGESVRVDEAWVD